MIGNTCYIYFPCLDKYILNPCRSKIEYVVSHASSNKSRVISCHLQDIGRYLITLGYNCYRGNNLVLMNKKETERDYDREATRHGGLGAYLSPSVSIKDRFAVCPHVMLNACLALSWMDPMIRP